MSTSKSLNGSRMQNRHNSKFSELSLNSKQTDIKGACYGVKDIISWLHNLIRCNGPYASSLLAFHELKHISKLRANLNRPMIE